MSSERCGRARCRLAHGFPLIERAMEDRQRPNWVLTEKLRADVDAVSVVGGNVRTVPLGIQRVAGEELS